MIKESKIILNEEEKKIIKNGGYFIRGYPKKVRFLWFNIVVNGLEMISSEKYAKSTGIPKKLWNKSYFKLINRRVLLNVVNSKGNLVY